jgi:hypothetical protein
VSYEVSREIVHKSVSKHGTRTVALVIAETAHHDGVGWLRIAPSKSKKQLRSKKLDTSNIAFRTKLSEKQVRRCVDRLQDLDELEVVVARDGGVRFFMYRLVVGALRAIEVDYSRGLPELEGQFWTPEELELPWSERPFDGHALSPNQLDHLGIRRPNTSGHFVRSSEVETGGHLRPNERAQMSAGRAGANVRSPLIGPVQEQPSLEPSSDPAIQKANVRVSAGADEPPINASPKDLVEALARAVGVWPEGHGQWSTWCAAMKPLAAAGVQPSEMETRSREYLKRWPLELQPGNPNFAFALTKAWQRINASLERSYFGLFRWATEESWRLGDIDHARWIVNASIRITEDERRRLLTLVEEGYLARVDARSHFLRWVESEGWRLDDDTWRHELVARTDPTEHGPIAVEMRQQAKQRRLAIRTDFANLDLGRKTA